jgi:hypothetical protein
MLGSVNRPGIGDFGLTLSGRGLVVFSHPSWLARIDPMRASAFALGPIMQSAGIREGTSIGNRDEKVSLSLGHALPLGTLSDRPHPGSRGNRPVSSLVRLLRSQRFLELWLCLIRAMQVDGRGEHGHLHAQWAVSAAKHPATTIEERTHRSTMPTLLALAHEVIE